MSDPARLYRTPAMFDDPVPAPAPVPVVPRWWYTSDRRTLSLLTFLPDYEPFQGEMVVVGMRASWGPNDADSVSLACDPVTGEYFRRITSGPENTGGKVFAPAPPPVGLWSGEAP